MLPFDRKLANEGHPLITRGGLQVKGYVDLGYDWRVPLRSYTGTPNKQQTTISSYEDGAFRTVQSDQRDLFLKVRKKPLHKVTIKKQ